MAETACAPRQAKASARAIDKTVSDDAAPNRRLVTVDVHLRSADCDIGTGSWYDASVDVHDTTLPAFAEHPTSYSFVLLVEL